MQSLKRESAEVRTAPPARLSQRSAQKRATREALAEAAVRLFADRGFDETTVGEIAAEAGVTERTFFLHFPTKQAAAFPDHQEYLEQFRLALAARPDGVDVLEHLRLVTGVGMRLKEQSQIRRPRMRLLARVPALADHDARMDRDYEEVIADHLIEEWGDDLEARVRARSTANVVLAVARAAFHEWAFDDAIDPVLATDAVLARVLVPGFAVPLPGDTRRPGGGVDLDNVDPSAAGPDGVSSVPRSRPGDIRRPDREGT